VGIEIVPHLTQALPLRQQHDESLDGRREGACVGTRRLAEHPDELGVRRQEVELRPQGVPQPLQGRSGGGRDGGESSLEQRRAARKYGLEESTLRVVVVEQQLLVYPGAARNPLNPRPTVALARKLVLGCRDDP